MIGEYKIVALCISRIQETFSHDFIITFSEVLQRAGYRLFVYNACSDLENDESKNIGQKFTFDLIDYSVVDALVIYEERIRNRMISDGIIAKGLQHKLPVIVIGGAHPGCVNIASNDPLGMEKMVRHLVEDHELRRLHFIAGTKGEHFSDERIAAFRKVLAEHGIPYDDSMLSYGEYWSGPTEAAVERIIASGQLPEAIVCVNDHTALSVCAVMERHGIKVPQDVKVTGYDGLFDTKISNPSITTVCCSILEYAEQTLAVVETAFRGEWEAKTVLFEPEIWKQESCGCGEPSNESAADYIISLKNSLYRFYWDNYEMSEISAKLQRSESPEQLSAELMHPRLFDICCAVEKRFLSEENALFASEEGETTEKEYVLLYNYLDEQPCKPMEYKKEQFEQLAVRLLSENRTLFFSALSYLDVPMGYICFYYRDMTVPNLLMMPQVTNFVGSGIGGYVNLRHAHYLNAKIEEMYRVDSLTGLYNRRGFSIEYQKLLSKTRQADKITVVLADIDGLKKINDKYGHAAGDIAISTVAAALRHACPKDSICVRFGGDEMLAVYPGEAEIALIRERFYNYLEKLNQTMEHEFEINASIGIYITAAGETPDFEEIVVQSDRLMYMEKEKRKSEQGKIT